jgi:deaminated glutathione amidase
MNPEPETRNPKPTQPTAPVVAIAQIESVRDPEDNLAKATAAVARARDVGAAMLVFPEYSMSWGPGRHDRAEMAAVAQPVDGGFASEMRAMARGAGMWIVAGMVEVNPETDGRPFNTVIIVDDRGELQGTYRKSHLFDAFRYRESDTFAPGKTPFHPLTTPLGCTGLFVCYELRFPEVARRQALAGATVLVVPTAWVAGPMKDMHWLTLLRARAIENGCYVVAAAQVGNEFSGQSMVVDPMGVITAQAGEEERVITAEIDNRRVEQVRSIVPSWRHRRPELY